MFIKNKDVNVKAFEKTKKSAFKTHLKKKIQFLPLTFQVWFAVFKAEVGMSEFQISCDLNKSQ